MEVIIDPRTPGVMQAPAPHERRVGILRGFKEKLFGEKPEDVKIEDHTKFILSIGRGLAPFLIVVFSLAFSLQLTGQAGARLWAALQGSGTLQITDAINFAATNTGIVALDITMIVAFVKVRDELSRGHGAGKWWGYALWGSLVCLIEAGTFFSMIVQAEKPTLWYQWIFAGARSLMTPGAAVFLVITPPRVLNEDEIILHVMQKVAGAMIEALNAITISGQAEFGKLLELFLHLALRDGSTDVKTFMTEMQALLNKISPSAMHEQYARVMQEMEVRMRETEAQINEAETRAYNLLRDALFGAFVAHAWPDHVLAVMPELEQIPIPDGTGATARPAVKALPASPANDLRRAAMDAGVERFVTQYTDPKTKAKKRSHGVWIRLKDIALFATEGTLTDDGARDIATKIGGGAKDGTTYCAPLRGVLAELQDRGKLAKEFERFVTSSDNSSEESETEGE